MLWNREDAEDATQEILVRIVTRLSQFDFRSRLKTWADRVAVNFILDVKKSAIERLHLSFERFAGHGPAGHPVRRGGYPGAALHLHAAQHRARVGARRAGAAAGQGV